MTEFEKMKGGFMYRFDDAEIMASVSRANKICAQMQNMTLMDDNYRELIEQLVPDIPKSTFINPPLHCDHGHGLRLGRDVFINYGGTFLDGCLITIGDRVKIGPNVQLVTPNHPLNYMERRIPQEQCSPITIGDDCWLGAGVIVCPGVTIGSRCVIGAGSVVVHDVPDDSLAVGNPAKVVRKLNGTDNKNM